MTDISYTEKVVMRRIRTIRVLKFIFSNAVLALFASGLALWGIGREVWVVRVFQNAPTDLAGAVRFYIYAFEHTRFTVQVLSLITLAALITLAREAARATASLIVPSHA